MLNMYSIVYALFVLLSVAVIIVKLLHGHLMVTEEGPAGSGRRGQGFNHLKILSLISSCLQVKVFKICNAPNGFGESGSKEEQFIASASLNILYTSLCHFCYLL